jgi:hypothetical protein
LYAPARTIPPKASNLSLCKKTGEALRDMKTFCSSALLTFCEETGEALRDMKKLLFFCSSDLL